MPGAIGSPLCAELNRIANNGVYPDRDDFLEEQGAANVWAGTTGQGLLGALNYIVDPTRTDNNYKGLTAVCNELAGTTGLSDVDALRTINHAAEVLLRGTTPQSASYYTDAATPRYNYPGYVYFNGTSGNYILVPDSTALDVTGDIDVRVQIALDDWTPATTSSLISKWQGGTNYSYFFTVETNGTLGLNYTTDGTAGTANFKYSTVATGIPDGATRWVRATRSSSTGSMVFYTSTDGSTWTQLGATVTSTPSAIYAGAANVTLMSNSSGGGELAAGKLYNAQIFASLNGTDKRLDVDLTTNVTSATYDQFTATTGQLCTINGQNTLTNGGSAGALLPITVGSSLAADSNDAKFLAHDGTNYVYVPGSGFNNIVVPDSAALDITGDLDLRAYVALDDWTPSAGPTFIAKDASSGTQSSFSFQMSSAGRLFFSWSSNGTSYTATQSTVSVTPADGAPLWVRATFDVDNGASGNDVKFWTSNDGSTWTQLGTTVTTAGVASIFAGTGQVTLGSTANTGAALAGKIYRAQILNGIDGTKVLDVDTSVITTGAATSFTAITGQTVTINRSTSGRKTVAVTQPTWLFGTDDYMEVNNRYMAHSTSDENYVYLSGASGNYMSVSDNPPLDVTGDIDLQVKVALDDWTPDASNTLIAKRNINTAYQFFVSSVLNSYTLGLLFSVDGTTTIQVNSTVAPTVLDGGTLWVRATRVASTGVVKFYTSNDGTTWTQLGTDVTSTTGNIFSSADPVEIGARSAGTNFQAKGAFYRAIIKNGIDGTTVLDANAAVITLPSQTTFVDSSSNAYTVTINKSGVGTFVSTGNYLYLPGVASNYASAPDSAALDITGNIDIRVKVALDDWTPSAAQILLGKRTAGQYSYQFIVNTNGLLSLYWSTTGSDQVTNFSTVAPTVADGGTLWVRATLSVASNYVVTYYTSNDGLTWTQLGSPVTGVGATSIFAGTAPIEVGSIISGTASNARGKFFRAQVLNGIGGTVAFDANFEGSITSLNQASFTESSSNAATVTINRSGSTFRSAGVIDAGYLYPGATNTFSNSTTNFLDFTATESLTAIAIVREWATPTSSQRIINKRNGVTGYEIYNRATSAIDSYFIGDGVDIQADSVQTSYTFGSLRVLGLKVDRSSQTAIVFSGTTNGTSYPTTNIDSLVTNIGTLTIGRYRESASGYADMEFVAAAVFRSALTTKNIADITNYFNGRD